MLGKSIAIGLFVSLAALATGSWMKQVSGIGRGNSYDRALEYANQNLQGEIDDLTSVCANQKGNANVTKLPQPHCYQAPFNWQCTVVGKVTCTFQK